MNIKNIAIKKGVPEAQVYTNVRQHLINNSAQWNSNQPPEIQYTDPLCRIAYLYGIVPVNANLLQHIFEVDSGLKNYFDQTNKEKNGVRVCAFGGGPGTELLGLAKWIEKRELNQTVNLDFLLVDSVNEWADSWLALRKEINERLQSRYGKNGMAIPLITGGSFLTVNINGNSNLQNWGNVFDHDIYILSYLISEIFSNFQNLRAFTSTMATHAPAGSKFLFLDRKGDRWEEQVMKLCKNAGLALSQIQYTQLYMDGDERKSDLGDILVNIQGRDPKLTWDAFWAVGTKI